jgi:hypothetical protein
VVQADTHFVEVQRQLLLNIAVHLVVGFCDTEPSLEIVLDASIQFGQLTAQDGQLFIARLKWVHVSLTLIFFCASRNYCSSFWSC